MKKLYFIVNLIAGRATIGDRLGEIIDEFNKADYEVTVHITQSGTDAADSTIYACENGYDILVCAGGDGTLSQCLQGMMQCGRKIPIGYLPAGSTNDFARTLGIPKNTMEAVKWITQGTPMACDIGKFNDNYFSYIVAFGAFTNVAYETPQQVKNMFGHVSYVLNGLTQLPAIRSKHMRIEYNNNSIEGDFIYGMVTNSSSVAGLLSMNDFLLDDGVFEVTLIKKPSNIVQLQQIVHSLLNITEEIDKDYIKFFRTNKITFTSLSGEDISWTRDGEFGGNAQVNTVCVCQRAIQFMIGDRIITDYEDPIENYLSE
ncbi:MAG: YegS/Rv2252/BmrU family lipid kinase [Ruminococcus sp.]|jgi:YegS/Rv2252/BmrU family lipid kinase|nr:YegS/Rv2252/BmrU family lipid kinase [Ruminococcus sp.]